MSEDKTTEELRKTVSPALKYATRKELENFLLEFWLGRPKTLDGVLREYQNQYHAASSLLMTCANRMEGES